jgi:hypothetical protein
MAHFISIAHLPDRPYSIAHNHVPAGRSSVRTSSLSFTLLQHKHFLDVLFRWRFLFLLLRLIYCDWLHLRRALANHLDGCHDLREPRTYSLRPEIGTLSSSEVSRLKISSAE